MRESLLCTGTKVDYRNSNLPVGNGYLDELLLNSTWRTALQDLLQYDAEEAMNVLQRVSGKSLYIRTPDAYGRISYPERAVWLDILTDRFYLNYDSDPIDSLGRARGVYAGGSEQGLSSLRGMPKSKLLYEPPIKNDDSSNQSDLRGIYDSDEFEYARRLLDGVPSGTVMDWKKRKR